MFNAQKLLGGLLSGSANTSGLGTRGGLGLGVLGVALAAAEHFMDQGSKTTERKDAAPPPPPPGAGYGPPPPPGSLSTPPPPPGATVKDTAQEEALLLLQAMIAAAHADGEMDPQERKAILSKLESLDLSPEERNFILQEFEAPRPLEEIVQDADSEELKTEVYAVSCLAVTVDTEAERQYLADLGHRLGLTLESREHIHRQLGIAL